MMAVAVAAHAQQVTPSARVTGGEIRGAMESRQAVFKGIPFAAPPVGPLRWRDPQGGAARHFVLVRWGFLPGFVKDPKDFRLIGHATTRLDAKAKSSGRQSFGIDVRLPGMLTAVMARSTSRDDRSGNLISG